ncbi:MAG: D-glycero-alpha-D-manno-heptose-1,7-bisphosphate 7-phosphatase [Christensenellales bacterium]|jgi:D-glycero-D-manno-heptose 1,7-bisphosphate phosphatase
MHNIAAFLDFQGTLGGIGTDDIRSLDFYPFSIEAIKKLNDNGILVIGITNQSHISKGELTWEEYEEKLNQIKDELSKNNAHFDAVYCCPHMKKDNCICKKPNTGMIDSATKDFDISIKNSFVVGDMGMTDMVLAKNIGAKAILVLTGLGKGSMNQFRDTWKGIEPDFVAENVLEAVNYILATVRTE